VPGFSSLVFVLSGVVLVGLITRSEESYWCCICVCVSNFVCCRNLSTRRPRPDFGCWTTEKEMDM